MWYVESTNVRGHYPLGRILELHYGPDSVARSAKVKFLDSELTRPLTNLVPVFDAKEA